MNGHQEEIARACMAGAEANTMDFGQIVGALGDAGFEGYSVDFRLRRAAYFLPDGDFLELDAHGTGGPVMPMFDADALKAAIREAQTLTPGYS